jgi:hypothetical protein
VGVLDPLPRLGFSSFLFFVSVSFFYPIVSAFKNFFAEIKKSPKEKPAEADAARRSKISLQARAGSFVPFALPGTTSF